MAVQFRIKILDKGATADFGSWSANFWPPEGEDIDFEVANLTPDKSMSGSWKFKVEECDRDNGIVYVRPYYPK